MAEQLGPEAALVGYIFSEVADSFALRSFRVVSLADLPQFLIPILSVVSVCVASPTMSLDF